MSFFKNTTTSTGNGGGSDKFVAPSGVYKCKLIDVQVTQTTKFQSTEMVDQYQWDFETTEVGNSEAAPFKFRKWTGTVYGPDKAKLTILMDGMLSKRYTAEEFQALDDAILFDGEYNVVVSQYTNAAGYPRNTVDSVKRFEVESPKLQPLRKAVAVVDNSDIPDPFEDEMPADATAGVPDAPKPTRRFGAKA
jgi:hypothetical protein